VLEKSRTKVLESLFEQLKIYIYKIQSLFKNKDNLIETIDEDKFNTKK
jgi:hypothetical protein